MIPAGMGADWLDDLPSELAPHVRVLRGIVAAAERDDRILAAQVQGSIGRGSADALSDLDVGLVVADEHWPAIGPELTVMAGGLGEVVDSYAEFVPPADAPELLRIWVQYASCVKLDMLVLPSTKVLGSGPDGRTLYDPRQLLQATDHPARLADLGTIAKWALFAWIGLTDVARFVERDRPAAAAEYMVAARQATISCWVAAHGVEFAGYANVAAAVLGVSCPWPDGLELTYPPPEIGAVLDSALALAALQDRVDRLLELRLAIPPRPLAAWVSKNLRDLAAARQDRDIQQAPSSPRETR